MHSSPKEQALDGMYALLQRSYQGNQQYRFNDTPYLEEATATGKRESILGHEWAMALFTMMLDQAFPKLSEAINMKAVVMLALIHDVGEIPDGDISMVRQLEGGGGNKTEIERHHLVTMIADLPPELQTSILAGFDLFEKKPVELIQDTAVLLTKMIDTLQGNHYILALGNNLEKYAELINKVINKHLGGTAHHLISILEEQGHNEAAEVIRTIVRHHLNDWKKAGIDVVLEGANNIS